MALPHLFWGYMKATYYSVLKPTANSTETLIATVGKSAVKGVAYSLGSVMIISGRTAYTLGANLGDMQLVP